MINWLMYIVFKICGKKIKKALYQEIQRPLNDNKT